jgi:excisionase family DNA binding protein
MTVIPLKQYSDEPLIDAEEAGKFLDVSAQTVKKWARRGIIPAIPMGSGMKRTCWRFRRSDLSAHASEISRLAVTSH